MTAASMATGGAALAGKAVMSAAAGATGGASAVQAAFQKASASMSSGGDVSSMGSITGGNSGGDGGSGGGAGTADSTPFAQASGFGGSGSSSSGGGFAKAAKLATGTASELAKGIGSQMKQEFQERVNETAGGKMAASIRESMEPKEAGQTVQFDGNSLGGAQGKDEVASFVNRDPDNNEDRS